MTQPMPSEELPVVHAVRGLRLMREALIHLDKAGAGIAAARLQHAIDSLDPPRLDTLN